MSENKREEKKSRPLLIYGYLGVLCMMFTLIAICIHYGWMEPRADAQYTPEDMIYMSALACGLFANLVTSRFINEYDNIHPSIRLIIRTFHWIMLVVSLIAMIDVMKRDDVDWVNLALTVIAFIVIVCVWGYMLQRKDKNGEKYEDRIERKANEKTLKLRIKRFDEREVMESRSAMGLPNPGKAEIGWDNHRTYVNVKRYSAAFISMMVLLSIVATIGKHLDSGDGATVAFFLAFIVGVFMLRTYVYWPVSSAVLHGAMRYEEGAKYGLLMMIGYSILCTVISYIVLEPINPIWDIWGYVMAVPTAFMMFLMTYLLVTLNNKHNGHVFAFFDTDGYAKELRDPRTENEDEEKK